MQSLWTCSLEIKDHFCIWEDVNLHRQISCRSKINNVWITSLQLDSQVCIYFLDIFNPNRGGGRYCDMTTWDTIWGAGCYTLTRYVCSWQPMFLFSLLQEVVAVDGSSLLDKGGARGSMWAYAFLSFEIFYIRIYFLSNWFYGLYTCL